MAKLGGANSQSATPSLYRLPLERIKDNSKRKLEDYLDPVLLHTISSKIGKTETKEKQMEKKEVFVNSNQRIEFDWPVDRLDPLINDPNRESARDSGEEDDVNRLFAHRFRSNAVEAISRFGK